MEARITVDASDVLAAITQAKDEIMATMKEYADQLTAAANDLKAAVQPLAGAINDFEARITALINNPQIPQDVQDQMTAALGDLSSVAAGVRAAVADAADGVDEAAQQAPAP